jgi:hypothetical protein
MTSIVILYFIIGNGCASSSNPVQSTSSCSDGHFVFAKYSINVDTLNGETIRCPTLTIAGPYYYFGDTLYIETNQPYNSSDEPVINGKSVIVTITSKFGDREDYNLKSGYLPCETRVGDNEIYRSMVTYAYGLGSPSQPFPNDGILEIRPTGDTLVASFKSFCSGDTLRDTAIISPK